MGGDVVEVFKLFADQGGLAALVILLLFILVALILRDFGKKIDGIMLTLGMGKADDKANKAVEATEALRAKQEILLAFNETKGDVIKEVASIKLHVSNMKQEVVRLGFDAGLLPERRKRSRAPANREKDKVG